MKKILIIGLVVVFTLTLTSVSFAGGHGRYYGGHRGRHGHGGHNNAGAILAGGLILGAGVLIGSVLSRPAPPPVYYPLPPPPPPSAYYPPPPPQGYYLSGATVIVEMKTWYTESVRYTIGNELGRHGAAVVTSNYRGKIDYVLEVYTGQDGGYNTVRIRLIRAIDGIPCDDVTGVSSPYYDGSDQERSYAWAAQRAVAKLR